MKHWQADEESKFCSSCQDSFSYLKRRHHCRVCGHIFCNECSSKRILIPKELIVLAPNSSNIKTDPTIPQRCCNNCSITNTNLINLQSDLRNTLSKANMETPVVRSNHDRYLNLPISFSLEHEIKKATYTLYNCTSDNYIEGKDYIPREIILNASGIAFLTIGKLGFIVSGRIGTGIVLARLNDGSWSAPSAIGLSGLGWGFQAGCELTDVILILNSKNAVYSFSSRTQFSLGTELGVSMGPIGRSAGTDFHAGEFGSSTAFSYAHSKGLFMGMSLEASVITAREETNRAFYGMDVKPSVLLSGAYPRPRAAEPLYQALSEVLTDVTPMILLSSSQPHSLQQYQSSSSIFCDNENIIRHEITNNNNNNNNTIMSSNNSNSNKKQSHPDLNLFSLPQQPLILLHTHSTNSLYNINNDNNNNNIDNDSDPTLIPVTSRSDYCEYEEIRF